MSEKIILPGTDYKMGTTLIHINKVIEDKLEAIINCDGQSSPKIISATELINGINKGVIEVLNTKK